MKKTLLHAAAQGGNPEIVEKLLDAGADHISEDKLKV